MDAAFADFARRGLLSPMVAEALERELDAAIAGATLPLSVQA